MNEINKYFPKNLSPGKKKDIMIHLLEKIERNRKLANEMHVKDVSEFKK